MSTFTKTACVFDRTRLHAFETQSPFSIQQWAISAAMHNHLHQPKPTNTAGGSSCILHVATLLTVQPCLMFISKPTERGEYRGSDRTAT